MSPPIGHAEVPSVPYAHPVDSPGRRLQGIDLLRGLAIVLMALDHTRDFFQHGGGAPTDLSTTTLPLFLTRWLTHYCAPGFIFLAGASVAFQKEKLGAATGPFLVRRGLWLMLLEVTWVNLSWTFALSQVHLGVLWAIGGAMVLLGLVVGRTRLEVGALGVGLTLLLGLPAVRSWALADAPALLRALLMPGGSWHLGPLPVYNTYVILPWFGVMAMGFGASRLLSEPGRRRLLLALGLAATVGFVALRSLNGYGDPQPWASHERGPLVTAMSFVNTTKYPPSLDFLLMTLGPALLALPLLDRLRGPIADFLRVFGRVPLFFYLLHLPLIHAAGLLTSRLRFGRTTEIPDQGLELAVVWGAWLALTLLLWWPCRAYDRLKREQRRPWMTWL